MSAQKQKELGGGDAPHTDHKAPKADDALAAKAAKAKDLLDKLDQAAQKKSGHWEQCCGVKVWVED